jgi:hypothetical protein
MDRIDAQFFLIMEGILIFILILNFFLNLRLNRGSLILIKFFYLIIIFIVRLIGI